MNISENKIVSVTYDLYVPTEEGAKELMESATKEQPLTFCYGIGMMLVAFEENLAGLKVGDKYDFTIPCAQAYGEYSQENVLELAKSIFEIDGKFNAEEVFEGNVVPLMDTEGNRFNAAVLEVGEATVTVDLNHPLAGEDLNFIGEVLDVHEATEEEMAAFTGGGCGCDGGCDNGCDGDCDDKKSSCGCH